MTTDIILYILGTMAYKDKIVSTPDILLGKPIIKGTRISVEIILKKLSEGQTIDDLLNAFPNIKKDDIMACLEYSAEVLSSEALIEA